MSFWFLGAEGLSGEICAYCCVSAVSQVCVLHVEVCVNAVLKESIEVWQSVRVSS